MHISKHLYTKKNGKLVRRKDIEKEQQVLLPYKKKPIEQNENIPPSEPLTEKEIEEIRKGILQHPALKLIGDEEKRRKIIFGDIEHPNEYDKFIDQKSNNSEMVEKSQVAILAKESAYLTLHLLRWMHEEIKEGDVIAEWYKNAPLPFTHRLRASTYTSYEIIEKILKMRGELSHLRKDFKTGYKRLLGVAGKCDKERPKWFGNLPVKPINDFKSASVIFLEIVKIINSEANIKLEKLTKTKGNGGKITIEIDYNLFNKSGSKELLKELYKNPSGVNINDERHGQKQPERIREILRKKGKDYELLADNIKRKGHTIYIEKKITLTTKNYPS